MRRRKSVSREISGLSGNSSTDNYPRTMSTWLYQYWLHAFKTAKHWGRGPPTWNSESLQFDIYQATSPRSIPSTPQASIDAAHRSDQPRISSTEKVRQVDIVPEPSQLCNWSLHYHNDVDCELIPSRTPTPEPDPDPLSENSWKPWPSSWKEPPYEKTLLESLASNTFSNIDAKSLPIAVPRIIEASKQSDRELLEEAVCFAVMARNFKLLDELMFKLDQATQEKSQDRNLLHLAASYLDGSKSCCTVAMTLLEPEYGIFFRSSTLNTLGHTVFDNLMISILKSHTAVTPALLDDSLRGEKRFAGEEVDICGRWDADSDCFRRLAATGILHIPFTWKHKFCHTSAQAISHYITGVGAYSVDIDDDNICHIPSGLFSKLCVSCGLKMQLLPLHTLVLTAFTLAQFGKQDEDLFGMLAVLLSVLFSGADPLLTADISISALFPGAEVDTSGTSNCSHEELRPAELATCIPAHFIDNWSPNTRTGWKIFCLILQRCEKSWHERGPELCTVALNHRPNYFGQDEFLGLLYGAVQTELLTYRRLQEGEPWVSANFDMETLFRDLTTGNEISIGLIENEMMQPVCHCGRFRAHHRLLPRGQEAMRYYFSNLEDWSRSTFLP